MLDSTGDLYTRYQTYGWDGTLIVTLGQFHCVYALYVYFISLKSTSIDSQRLITLSRVIPCIIHLDIFDDSLPVSIEHRAHRSFDVLETVSIIMRHMYCELIKCYFVRTFIPTHLFLPKWRVDKPDHACRRTSKCQPSLRPIKSVDCVYYWHGSNPFRRDVSEIRIIKN